MDNENKSINIDDSDFEEEERNIINRAKFSNKIPTEINEEGKDFFEETTKSKSNHRRFICKLCDTKKVNFF